MKTCFSTVFGSSLLAAGVALTSSAFLPASAFTFSGSSGSLSASADFQTSGSNLLVTLTNTSTADVLDPTDVLTGIFFNLSSGVTLKPVSAALGSGSQYVYGSLPSGETLSDEWAYKSGINVHGANTGISAAGLGVFGGGDVFGSNNSGVQGLDYGIVSAGDTTSTGNTGVTKQPLIDNSVVFTFTGLPTGFDVSKAISGVVFQYGTALDETSFAASPAPAPAPAPDAKKVPEPSAMGALLLAGLAILRFGRKQTTVEQ